MGSARNEQQTFQVFNTPEDVADELCELADIGPGDEVMEPSAGSGTIALAARARHAVVTCFEIRPDACAELKGRGFRVIEGDFLEKARPLFAGVFDKVVMNPPWNRGRDVAHVVAAFGCLRPGGQLAAIVSPAAVVTSSRNNALAELLRQHGRVVRTLPTGTFKDEGTNVGGAIIFLQA